ncbi:head fiber protein [Arthrobacter phage Greenhouse]|uniref:Uncharacterized protein n=6 Tax=Korravirus TaxID=1982076 RepID=A0A1I9SE34_9CAUD|nr:head fiber protein [Arthrobacter phage GreenHearts]YP_010049991.1 head fiber protein [Arthrobacter phage Greenhouse]YP_010050052.1 head fiber protein [Arthrobacter phage Huntingdon]YP_010050300.1 head fiber protein [Arthrobacter phage Nubia]YP_010050361.1 head fiber protein [Arthrobacter phage Oxynfrius]AOQ28221.1 hypothetical protein SEA_RCIGASTRUGA_9 [Arthrobacter phage RcigaStruga]UYL86736.1 hypothetical protein SEA_ALBANESE_9 [Arthrobacter phage Albanese]WKW85566.1 hypothetical protei
MATVEEQHKLRLAGQAATVAAQGALTATASVAAPTKAEFDKVVADNVAGRNKLNELIAALKTAGIVA